VWCLAGLVSHVSFHALDILFIGRVDPFFCCPPNFVLDLPLCSLRFTPSSDRLNISHDSVHRRSFTTVGCWALCGIVAELVAFETRNVGRVVSVSSVSVWELLWLIPCVVWWWVDPRCIGVPLVIWWSISSAVVIVPSIVA
jgi:hypothetical protein